VERNHAPMLPHGTLTNRIAPDISGILPPLVFPSLEFYNAAGPPVDTFSRGTTQESPPLLRIVNLTIRPILIANSTSSGTPGIIISKNYPLRSHCRNDMTAYRPYYPHPYSVTILISTLTIQYCSVYRCINTISSHILHNHN